MAPLEKPKAVVPVSKPIKPKNENSKFLFCSECNKRIAAPTETNDTLQCGRCNTKLHARCHQPPLNADLVKRFPSWECGECKHC